MLFLGGEPLIQDNVDKFIHKIKSLGYKVKLDTNGINSQLLKELLDAELLDYVAMDIKNDFDNYSITTGINSINTNNIKSSIELLKNSKIDYEFRTTIVKEFHNIESIKNICEMIGKDSRYFIQNFEDSSNVLNHNLHGFTKNELIDIQHYFENEYPMLKVRGI